MSHELSTDSFCLRRVDIPNPKWRKLGSRRRLFLLYTLENLTRSHSSPSPSAALPQSGPSSVFETPNPRGVASWGRAISSLRALRPKNLRLCPVPAAASCVWSLIHPKKPLPARPQVWDAYDGDVDAAAEMLLSMSLEEQSRPSSSRPPDDDDAPVFSSTHDGEEWGWSVLPEECKDLTIQLLSMRDLARASCVCRELSQARPPYTPSAPYSPPSVPLSRSEVRG